MNEHGAQILSKHWGFGPVSGSNLNEIGVTAAHWHVEVAETPDVDLSNNVLALSIKPCRTTRFISGGYKSMSLQNGGVGLLAAGPMGRWTYDSPQEVIHIYIPQSLITRVAAQSSKGCIEPILREGINLADPFLTVVLNQAQRAMGEGYESALYISSFSESLAHHLIRYHSNAHSIVWPRRQGVLAAWQQRRVIEFLQARICDEPTLSQIAEQVGLSAFHFARAFKISTGVSPYRYLIQLRIIKARWLLENSDFPISEISARVGYDDPSYFARLFRREVGVTPAAYRRERRR